MPGWSPYSTRNDTFETRDVNVDEMLSLVPEGSRVWEAFPGTGRSARRMRDRGYATTTLEGDFFENVKTPPECDVVVTNPPFSRKMDVLRALLDAGLPFVMVFPTAALMYKGFPREEGERLAVTFPRERMRFVDPETGDVLGRPTFDCCYLHSKCFAYGNPWVQ